MLTVPGDRPSVWGAPHHLRAGEALVWSRVWANPGASNQHDRPNDNQLLTKLIYLEPGHSGRVCWLAGQPVVQA